MAQHLDLDVVPYLLLISLWLVIIHNYAGFYNLCVDSCFGGQNLQGTHLLLGRALQSINDGIYLVPVSLVAVHVQVEQYTKT